MAEIIKNKRCVILSAVLLFTAVSVFAQNSVSLEAEILNNEKTAAAKVQAPERRDALIRLARLRQLSGDIEGAAKNWLEAAAAVAGEVDDDALLACAYCLAAMGEWDRASTALEPLLSKSIQARFLKTSINAIKSGDTQPLAALAETPEFDQMKTQIFFLLWKISRGTSGETWRQRLISEAPQSPEGRLAAGEKSSTVIVKVSPFWLFLGGLDSLPIVKTETVVIEKPASTPTSSAVEKSAPAPTVATVEKSAPSSTTATVTEKPAPAPAPVGAVIAYVEKSTPAPANNTAVVEKPTPVSVPRPPAAAAVSAGAIQSPAPSAAQAKLQTGLYGKEANAQAQIASLKKAGFPAALEQRGNNWVVFVPTTDQSRTIKELKSAGFDSFPIK